MLVITSTIFVMWDLTDIACHLEAVRIVETNSHVYSIIQLRVFNSAVKYE